MQIAWGCSTVSRAQMCAVVGRCAMHGAQGWKTGRLLRCSQSGRGEPINFDPSSRCARTNGSQGLVQVVMSFQTSNSSCCTAASEPALASGTCVTMAPTSVTCKVVRGGSAGWCWWWGGWVGGWRGGHPPRVRLIERIRQVEPCAGQGQVRILPACVPNAARAAIGWLACLKVDTRCWPPSPAIHLVPMVG